MPKIFFEELEECPSETCHRQGKGKVFSQSEHVAHREQGGRIVTVITLKFCPGCKTKWREVHSERDFEENSDQPLTAPSRFGT